MRKWYGLLAAYLTAVGAISLEAQTVTVSARADLFAAGLCADDWRVMATVVLRRQPFYWLDQDHSGQSNRIYRTVRVE